MLIRNVCLLQKGMEIPHVSVGYNQQIQSIEKCKGTSKEGPDWDGYFLVPGFVDVHIHGAAGFDTCDNSKESLFEIETFLYSKGVTRFLPTTLSLSHEQIISILETVRGYMQSHENTSIVGVHLEGPYLNPQKKGAHQESLIRPFSHEEWNDLILYSDLIRIITLAPEIPENSMMIPVLRKEGIHVSIGHTNATYGQCLQALDQGASRFTHLFNAMGSLHHREPSASGAGLLTNAFVELVCDRLHICEGVVRLAFQAKDPNQIVLITDSMRATGLPYGRYSLGELEVQVGPDGCRLADGTLAGSTLTMDQALKNAREITGLSLSRIIGSATSAPASSAGLEEGWIDLGQPADMAILSPDLTVVATIKGGKTVFGALQP